jgi:hypothetical protein
MISSFKVFVYGQLAHLLDHGNAPLAEISGSNDFMPILQY